jgi:valyl-tRNA synthetase
VDRWIRHRLNAAAATTRSALEGYRYNEAAQAVYEFIWNDFCDWYIEAAKLSLAADDAEKDRIVTLLLGLLEESLRLAHPFLPLITEEIWLKLPAVRQDAALAAEHAASAPGEGSIMVQPYPGAMPDRTNPEVEAKFASIQELIRAVRTIRSEFTIPPDARIRVSVLTEKAAETRQSFEAHRALISHLAGIGSLAFPDARPSGGASIAAAGKGFEVFVDVEGAIDAPREIARLSKDRQKAQSEIERTQAKLATASFVERAPKEVVDREKEKLAELARLIDKIDGYVRTLQK